MVKITHTHGQKAKETGKKSSANKAKRKKNRRKIRKIERQGVQENATCR